MHIKTYGFAGCKITLTSDTPVYDSSLFDEFRRGESAGKELKINILHSPLPEKSGILLYEDETSSLYDDGEKSMYFTRYPDGRGIKDLGCRIVKNGEITLYIVPGQKLWDSLVAFAVNYTALLFCMGIATMHCSCIETDGKAILFAGDKGVGKSTQAALWEKYKGAEIINGDRIALEITQNGLTASGIPFCGSSKTAKNKTLDVKAIVLPGKAPQNTAERLDAMAAFKAVLSNLTYIMQDNRQMKTAVDIAQAAAENIPVFRLMCLPDEGSVKTLEEQLCLN